MPKKADESVGGESLVSYNHRPRTFGQGRLCLFEGCSTRLSIYNSEDFCARHGATHSGIHILAASVRAAARSDHEQPLVVPQLVQT